MDILRALKTAKSNVENDILDEAADARKYRNQADEARSNGLSGTYRFFSTLESEEINHYQRLQVKLREINDNISRTEKSL